MTISTDNVTNLQGLDNCWQHLPTLYRPQIDSRPFSNTSAPYHKHKRTYTTIGQSSSDSAR